MSESVSQSVRHTHTHTHTHRERERERERVKERNVPCCQWVGGVDVVEQQPPLHSHAAVALVPLCDGEQPFAGEQMNILPWLSLARVVED